MTDQPRKIEDGTWAFPLPLTKPLSMNDRQHWSAKAGAVADLRHATNIMAKAAKIPKCQRIRVTLVYEPRDQRRRDPINLAATLKPVQDGIVDAKIVPDDAPQYMESPMPIIDEPIGGKHGKMWVLVERLA